MAVWIAVILLALAAFALAALVLRLPREGYALFGSVLLFGLAGYAWQGSPELRGSPKAAMIEAPRSGEDMIEDDAAGLLRRGLTENPDHLEGWLALAMALTAHADGFVTPAAIEAYGRARAIDSANPAADFFLGFAFLQSGEIRRARAVWADLLERSPEDAPWRADLAARVVQLDAMIANAPMLQ